MALDLASILRKSHCILRLFPSISRFFKRTPIRVWLILSYSALFIGVMVPLAIGLNLRLQALLEENIEAQLENATINTVNMVKLAAEASIKQHLRATAEKNIEIVQMFHEDAKAGRITMEEAKRQATRILLSQKIGITGYIYVLDSSGQLQVHPEKVLLKKDLRDFQFIREQIVQKNGYIEYEWKNPQETRTRPKALYMAYFEPWDWIISVSSYREEFVTLIHVDEFRQQILANRFGKSGYTYVMDSRGTMIIHPVLVGNIYDAEDSSGRRFTEEMCRKKNGRTKYSWKNPGEEKEREKIAIYRYLPELDWIVVSSGYLEEVYAPLITMRNVLYVAMLITLLLLLTVSFLISRIISRPLQSIITAFAQGAAGQFKTRIRTRATGEIRVMANYFNKFMRELDQYGRSLRNEIRERKNAQRDSEKNERRLRMILSSANEGFMEVGSDRLILDINPEMSHILGRPPEEILGRKIFEFVDPPSAERIREHLELRKIGLRSSYEATLLRPDGSRVICLFNGAPILDEKGRKISSFAMITDITVRKLDEEEVRRVNEELERRVEERTFALQRTLQMVQEAQEHLVQSEKMAALGQLVAGVAHEINTPVGVGVTAATHLQESTLQVKALFDGGQLTRAEMVKYLSLAEEGSSILVSNLKRAADLIGSFKQIATDRASGDERRFVLAEYVQELLLSLRPHLKHTAHEVRVDCPPDLAMQGSPGAFSQILINLVMNSLTHGFEGIPAGVIAITVTRSEAAIILEYRDNGVGIHPDNLNRIFDPFFTTKRGQGGSGLGLHIVYNLVTRTFGGRIHVESIPGQGVVFTLTLPVGEDRDDG